MKLKTNRFRQKRILYIVEAMGGGVFTYMVELLNQLVNEYDVYLAYATRKQTPKDYREYFDSRIHLIEVKHFVREINPIKDSLAGIELKKIANSINPEVIHLHSSKAGAIGRIVFNGKKIPLFYTPHGYSFLISNNTWLKRALFRWFEVLLGNRVCQTVACSQGEYRESLQVTKQAIFISNGVDIKKLDDLPYQGGEKEKQTLTIFTSGRICGQKNPVLFNEIAMRFPHIKFLWIGTGEYITKLTSNNIQITGWITRNEVLSLASDADIFLLPSLWEGLPMALLEAMYLKKICLVSDVSGNNDVIKDGINGFL